MKKSEISQVPQLIIIPANELAEIKLDIKTLKEFYQKATPSLGNWLTQKETEELLQRKCTSIWRLRENGTIIGKKIGGKNYYSKKSIIDFLDSE